MELMPIVLILNALASGSVAAIWSKAGALNIMIAMFFVCLTIANCIVAARFL